MKSNRRKNPPKHKNPDFLEEKDLQTEPQSQDPDLSDETTKLLALEAEFQNNPSK